jgi:large subunit ribosomal protein L18
MKTIQRRRAEGRTDYAKRIKFLKSETPRLVFRKTNRYILAQYVTSNEAQDKVEFGVTSKQLMNFGWPKEFEGSLKSVPASYLTGLLMGKEIIKNKMEVPIFDIGMTRAISKNKAFAFLKGITDAGVEMNVDEKVFPEEDRINGKNLKKDFSKTFKEIKSKVEENKTGTRSTKKK